MSPENHEPWQFWIDVGGTFTDCVARRPDGSLVKHKLLSTGVTRGLVGPASDRLRIVDPTRAEDPTDFWRGCQLRLLDDRGVEVAAATVVAFDPRTATLGLSEALPIAAQVGQPYELHSGEEAPLVAIRYLLGLAADAPIPEVFIRLGTTRGTNALLTRRGATVAFVTTRGFGDILRIGYQNRPRLFDLAIRKPAPLFAEVVEIDERVTAQGQVLLAPEKTRIRQQLTAVHERGIQSLAICLLHSSKYPAHEEIIASLAHEVGFREISASSEVAPLVKIVPRGDTTVVDAYLNPILRQYVEQLRSRLEAADLQVMTSAGGLVTAERFSGKDSILSGPAGGVIGFSRIAQAAGFERAIGFDMGGTSSDVSRFDGRCELEYETQKAGVRIVAPMLAIETVAAGGGSICDFDGAKLVVGPDSAGASPGPAAYGRGGPLAVTDVNFYLGKIPPERFPFPLNRGAIEVRLQHLIQRIGQATGTWYSPVALCEGFVKVANANMIKAIRSISVAKGYDPREYVLVPFGGAAGQHACGMARELGIRQVLCHPDAGILSAYGLGLADTVKHRAAGIYRPYAEDGVAQLSAEFDQLVESARREVLDECGPATRIEVRRLLDLRYQGLDAFLTIPEPYGKTYSEAYAAEHRRLYGFVDESRPIEMVAARVEAIGRQSAELPRSVRLDPRDVISDERTTVWFNGQQQSTPIYGRASLAAGQRITGPAVVCEATSTTVVDPGWTADVLSGGELLLTDRAGPKRDAISTDADPAMLEVFHNQFAGIAEQMGLALKNTASSVNVKERLDFSCAVFTASGDLVANAPHIPVHLGAMSDTVKWIIADNPDMAPEDVFVTNDPYRGGSHLPDVTVVSPVHDRGTGQLLFFTASRAHHAEIGGIAPGSMPPFSTNLAQEGVLLGNVPLIRGSRSHFDELARLLTSAPHPTRNVADNLADIAAQVAANCQGVRELEALVRRYSLRVVQAYMRHIQSAAERKMRSALVCLPRGRHEFIDRLDDGSPIAVAFTIAGDSATIDFTGTGSVLPGNLNANRAIVTAAVMYVLRLLIDEDIPLNQGVLAPVRIVLPECLLNPSPGPTPAASPAIVGGNVETSQRIVDVLLGALGAAAASQGTMNNLLFGDASFGYYETICGGSGATPDADGADAVHTHMTNTRLTDPEVLERRYPVLVREFSIRRGSGGKGRWQGGDGVVRRLEFLRKLDASILSQRRGPYPPYGLAGGEPGALGRNILERADGSREILPALAQFTVQPGDVLTLETPGGGGYGSPSP